MRRMCLALDLKNDPELIAAYRKWHEPGAPPRAVSSALREAGITGLDIYLTGNRLFMILETTPQFSLDAKAAADRENRDVQAWEALMWNFQQSLPWAAPGQKWVPMEKIYALADQP